MFTAFGSSLKNLDFAALFLKLAKLLTLPLLAFLLREYEEFEYTLEFAHSGCIKEPIESWLSMSTRASLRAWADCLGSIELRVLRISA
jgi:hypothetical protein